MAPISARVRASLKPQSNCVLYSGGGTTKLAASWATVGAEICCQGRSWANAGVANKSDRTMDAKVRWPRGPKERGLLMAGSKGKGFGVK